MPVPIKFSGEFRATEFAYGLAASGTSVVGGKAITVDQGNTATGSSTVTVAFGNLSLVDGTDLFPFATNAPITIGTGSTQETVTPTAVTDNVPTYRGSTVTASFSNLHYTGEPITSGTVGLQEAINYAYNVHGGGQVIVDALWTTMGGTDTILAAASLPSNGSVVIVDNRGLVTPGVVYWANRATSTTVVSAPSAATSSTVASLTTTGTWTATTEHVLFTYVTAAGGETLASSDYSFSATASKAIGGTGPAAATGAVGYNVYIGANATTTCYQVPPTSANGTVITCGAVKCFQIGTNFSVATATTNAGNLIPVQSSAFSSVKPQPQALPPQGIQMVTGPFAVTGVITSGTAAEQARVALPTGYLNYAGRRLRITAEGIFTPVSTAGPKFNLLLSSVYGTTNITMWTVTNANTTGTTAADYKAVVEITTVATGSSGTIEAHGWAITASTTGTANIAAATIDTNQTVGSAIDLTAQNFVSWQMDAATANITQSQCRRFVIEVLA